jgi:sigma-B regulation protein RsbU (phosphoserine phosphatase)
VLNLLHPGSARGEIPWQAACKLEVKAVSMAPATKPMPSVAARTVLVVDDQPDVLEALRLVLKSAGYVTRMADSPEGALAAAATYDPDLIVIDMNYAQDTTSGEEGIVLLDRLRALRRKVPILAMTGWSTIELAVRAMQHGAADFITKPWDVKQLLATFEKHLNTGQNNSTPDQAHATELAIARRIQQKLLPPTDHFVVGLQFACAFLPAGDVGGDLYDIFELDNEQVAFLLADVSGKGMGAALLVATLQATIRGQREHAAEPARLLERVNRLFYQATRPEHFATLFFGVYHAGSRSFRYVNCGHPPGVLLRADGTQELLKPTSLIVGAFETCDFQERSERFEPGDRLVLFSDGVSEAGMDEDEEWATEAIRILARKPGQPIAGSLAAAANAREAQMDDITVIDIRSLATT